MHNVIFRMKLPYGTVELGTDSTGAVVVGGSFQGPSDKEYGFQQVLTSDELVALWNACEAATNTDPSKVPVVRRPKSKREFHFGDYVSVKVPGKNRFYGTVYSMYQDRPGRERIICVETPDGAGVGYRVRYVKHAKKRG